MRVYACTATRMQVRDRPQPAVSDCNICSAPISGKLMRTIVRPLSLLQFPRRLAHSARTPYLMRPLTARVLSLWSKENTMKRRSILSVSARIALGLVLFGITAGSTARAAEIKVLCAVALQPAMIELIPDFEKSSGHKVTIAYANAGP